MKYRGIGMGKSPLLVASILICGLFVAGCEGHIDVVRDPDIRVVKGSTWAWKPATPVKDADRRPVVSRDVISRGETVAREPGPNNEIVRERFHCWGQVRVRRFLPAKLRPARPPGAGPHP